jgi:hypothetical protein
LPSRDARAITFPIIVMLRDPQYLEKGFGIDVGGPWCVRRPAEKADRIVAAQDHVPSPAIAPPGDIRRRRAYDGDAGPALLGACAETRGHCLRLVPRGLAIGHRDRQLDEPAEGG